jgi:acylphosphatase
MAGNNNEQREIYYSGRVQGVGFRYTARAIATDRRVSGFVRNLPDGRVHMVIEGLPDDIQAFIKSLEADMGGYIHNTQVLVRPATGRFQGFEIRF